MRPDTEHLARELLEDAVLWDNHACLPLRPDAAFLPQLEKYRHAGVTVVSINVGFAEMPWTEQLRILSFMRRWISQRSDRYSLVTSVDDVRRCKAERKLGMVFDMEGMGPVLEDISLVQTFYELGVRWMLIAYNRNNRAGGGCLDQDNGLTTIGRSIIDEMERVGMVLCLSHVGARTAEEALEYSRNPVIFSHSNAYAKFAHPRNISDDLIRACARKDGVVGLNGFGAFLGAQTNLIEHLLQQLTHVIDLVGPAYVGLGLDYVFDTNELQQFVESDPSLFPAGLSVGPVSALGPEVFGQLAERLARSNMSDQHIRGVLGGNWLRVASQVWR